MKSIGCGLFALAGTIALAQGAEAQIIISKHATQNMSCSGGVCTPTAAKAYMNVYSLLGMLANGNTIIEGNATAPDIISNVGFSLPSTSFTLTLEAQGNLTINHAIKDPGPPTTPMNLVYDANGQGGLLSFGKLGKLTFASTSTPLSINGQAFTLVANIATLARLIQDNPSGDFALAANYNAKRDGTYSQSPIPTPFAGIFAGLGNTISNLKVESAAGNEQPVGFFQGTSATAYIAWLNMEITITGCPAVGGVVGDNEGSLYEVAATANVVLSSSCSADVGAAGVLAGINDGDINQSESHGSASTSASYTYTYLGGLAGMQGYAANGVLANSLSDATVTLTGNGGAGGLVGYFGTGGGGTEFIYNVLASGAVTITGSGYGGGLVGYNLSYVEGTQATGNVAVNGSTAYAGGLVGYNSGDVYNGNTAKGAVSAAQACDCGGAVGWNNTVGLVSDIDSYGTVTGGSGSSIGGFVGYDSSFNGSTSGFSNDGWDMTTSGITNPSQGAGNVPNDPGITGFN